MAATYDLIPNATETSGGTTTNWAANPHLAIDDPPGSPDDATTQTNSTNTSAVCRMQVAFAAMADASQINRITLHTRISGQAGQGAGVTVDTFIAFGSAPTVRYTGTTGLFPEANYADPDNNTVDEWTVNPATGEPFTQADLDDLQAGVTYTPTSDPQDALFVTQLYVRVEYVAVPEKIGTVRDVASRHLLTFRRPTSVVEIVVGMRWADVEIGDVIALSHFAGETPEDAGWRSEPWERRLFFVLGSEIDYDAMTVRLRLFDVRDYLASLWDTAISEEAPGIFAQGIARLDTGATRTFTRDSKAWVENGAAAAQGSVEVVEISSNVEKHDASGMLIEAAGTNEQIQSSFANGETGWTSSGEGSNGSSIDLDTDDLLLNSDVSGNSFQFTAGNPIHVADLQILGTATSSFASSTIIRASFDHKDDSGATLQYFLQRGSSDYWRDSDSSWQAAKTWNAMTASVTPHRHITKQIDIGANARTLQAGVGIPTTGTAGQINHLYHVQIEDNEYATSRIVTGAATVTRALDNLSIQNDHGKRTWPIEQGTGFCQFSPEWATADLVAGAQPRLFVVQFDSSNLERVFYNQATGAFVYRRIVAGVTYSATFTQTAVRGTVYDIAWRWCGAEGEHDLDPYTLSIFVNGVKGTDVVAVPFGSVTSEASIHVGQSATNANHADGFFRHIRLTPLVLTDAEIADLP